MKFFKPLFILFCGVCLGSISSARPNFVSRTNFCTVLLDSVRSFHTVPSVSKSYTRDAVSNLRTFRVNTLNQPVVNASSRETGGKHHTAGSGDRQLVAERLRGIENYFAEENQNEDFYAGQDHVVVDERVPNQATVVAGTVFEGEEARQVLDLQTRLTEGLEEKYFRRDLHTLGGATLSAFSWYFIYSGLGNFVSFLRSGHEALAALMVPVVLGASVLFKPDKILFYLRNQDFAYWRRTNRLEDVLAHPGPDKWYFDSFDFKMTPELFRSTWLVGLKKVSQVLSNEGVNPWLLPLRENQWQTRSRLFSEFREDTVVRIDRLLTFDAETNQPRLTVFVRSSINKPQSPKILKSAFFERVRESLRFPVVSPALVPTTSEAQ